jgi:hypothetical protein
MLETMPSLDPVALIARKRDALPLTREEIQSLITGLVSEVNGPAIVRGATTTIVIPPWSSARARRTAAALRFRPSESTPVPGPTQSSAAPPKRGYAFRIIP